MKFKDAFLRICFAFAIVEAVPIIFEAIRWIKIGQRPVLAVGFLVYYGLISVCAWRMLRKKHVPSARGLMLLRVGIIVALTAQFLLLRPMPPITILLAKQLLQMFQLYLAVKAHACCVARRASM